jgi:hypothetical protein
MEFLKINNEERKLLLDVLGYKGKIKCHYCGAAVNYKKCGIMPYLIKGNKKKHTTILCDSALCMTEYIGNLERIGVKFEEAKDYAERTAKGKKTEQAQLEKD